MPFLICTYLLSGADSRRLGPVCLSHAAPTSPQCWQQRPSLSLLCTSTLHTTHTPLCTILFGHSTLLQEHSFTQPSFLLHVCVLLLSASIAKHTRCKDANYQAKKTSVIHMSSLLLFHAAWKPPYQLQMICPHRSGLLNRANLFLLSAIAATEVITESSLIRVSPKYTPLYVLFGVSR